MTQATLLLLIQLLTTKLNFLKTELAQQTAEVSSTPNVQPIYTPPVLSAAPPIESPVLTAQLPSAWIEVNGATGTVQLPSGTYAGTETWGSTGTTSCTVKGGQWIGNFGTSGSKNTGLIVNPTTVLTINCDNGASSSVTVITN